MDEIDIEGKEKREKIWKSQKENESEGEEGAKRETEKKGRYCQRWNRLNNFGKKSRPIHEFTHI